MIHKVMLALTWAIGGLGVSGTIAAIAAAMILGPAAVLAFIQPLITRFLACTKCLAATVFLCATLGAYWLGHHQAVAECRAEELEAQLRNERIDRANDIKAKEDETSRADSIERDARDQHQQDLAEIARLKTRPPNCAFDDDDAGSLRAPASGAGGAKPAKGTR